MRRADDYRANGERLKPLENAIKSYLHLPHVTVMNSSKILKVGDKAPNFLMQGILPQGIDRNFLADNADIKILSFYPAVFSGILKMPRNIAMNQSCINPLNCKRQTSLLDKLTIHTKKHKNIVLKKYLMSNTTSALLEAWYNITETKNMYYLNDPDASIAQQYNALDKEGYLTRITYVIDALGIIRGIFDLQTEEDILNLKQWLENNY